MSAWLVPPAAPPSTSIRLSSVCPLPGEAVSLKVRGLKGGHSGGDIDKERGNANKIAARVLYAIAKEMKVNLVSMDGGMMMNAIPRECDAVAAVADACQGQRDRW